MRSPLQSTVTRAALAYSGRARRKRAEVFRSWLKPAPGDRILDLGGEDGGHIAQVVPFRDGVVVADISPDPLRRAAELYGFETLLIDENGMVPAADRSFDIVFCSSVIEHVTVDKDELESYTTKEEFVRAASRRQEAFAKEVRRIANGYFVQTPNRYFPIESHTWLPAVVVFLPRRAQIRLLHFTNRWWPKKTSPDWHLLTYESMQRLFPDAQILRERSFGLTKSLIAVRTRS